MGEKCSYMIISSNRAIYTRSFPLYGTAVYRNIITFVPSLMLALVQTWPSASFLPSLAHP